MKITFLGTGAAEGVPAMFCACPFCTKLRKLGKTEYHTRSQVLIDGVLSVDFPPEAYSHSLDFNVGLCTLKHVLVTHSHMDHFYAHDFVLRGYKYAATDGSNLEIYGNSEVQNVFSECTRREMKSEVLKNLSVKVVRAFSELCVGDFRVLSLPAEHGTGEEALLYYIENGGKGYLHLYDTGALSDGAIDYLADRGAKVDLIAFDCTFLDAPPRKGTRHMCIEDNIGIFARLKERRIADSNTKCVITHFSHNAQPSREKLSAIEKKYSVIAAYDGMTLEI